MIALTFSKAIVEALEEELWRAQSLNNLRLYKRVQALLWIAAGKSLVEIGHLLKLSSKTVSSWLREFLVNGVKGLLRYRYRGRGRKSKLNAEQKQHLYQMVVAGPQAQGFDCGVWNTALIGELIWRRFGVRYNLNYLSSLLKQLGLSYQKARFITDRADDEAYQRTRRRWVEQSWPKLRAQAQATGAMLLFVDEVSFALWGSLSRTWAPRGQQPVVKTTGQRKGMKLFGAIDFFSGAFYFREAHAYTLTASAFKRLKQSGVPASVLSRLKALKDQRYRTQSQLHQALETLFSASMKQRYQARIINASEGSGQFNGDSYIEFLNQLLEQINTPIILIHDGAPYHRSQAVKRFCTAHRERLTVEPLPAFSPDYNPIEKLWKKTKKEATHLKYFKTFDELRASVLKAFHNYLKDASQVIGVMKKLRADAGLRSA